MDSARKATELGYSQMNASSSLTDYHSFGYFQFTVRVCVGVCCTH